MPIRDIAAMNSSLNNDYGSNAGPNAPTAWELALFDGDPMIAVIDGGGTEMGVTYAAPGYGRVSLPQSAWAPAANGMKKLTSPAQMPNTAGEWASAATHWALFAAGTSVMWDCGPLTEPLEITGAGAGPAVNVAVYYDDNVTEEEED